MANRLHQRIDKLHQRLDQVEHRQSPPFVVVQDLSEVAGLRLARPCKCFIGWSPDEWDTDSQESNEQ